MSERIFGYLPSGEAVHEYTLHNASGMQVQVMGYGAIITGVLIPDEQGTSVNMVLRYDTLAGYLDGSSYLGAVVGRVANRIAQGRFTLDGQAYALAVNNGANHLHGGEQGFNRKLWRLKHMDEQTLVLMLDSASGDQGYPGSLHVEVEYRLRNDNTLAISYQAQCRDAATPINLTQHSYFNLSGGRAVDISEHSLQLFCSRYTPVDKTGIPTGKISPVAGTDFDFSLPKPLNRVLHSQAPEVVAAAGLDHNFVVNEDVGRLAKVAVLCDEVSGRSLDVFSSQPGVQVYTGNFLDVDAAIEHQPMVRHGGICLECQSFPDAVNHSNFPSTIIQPGEQYRETTCYRFRWP